MITRDTRKNLEMNKKVFSNALKFHLSRLTKLLLLTIKMILNRFWISFTPNSISIIRLGLERVANRLIRVAPQASSLLSIKVLLLGDSNWSPFNNINLTNKTQEIKLIRLSVHVSLRFRVQLVTTSSYLRTHLPLTLSWTIHTHFHLYRLIPSTHLTLMVPSTNNTRSNTT